MAEVIGGGSIQNGGYFKHAWTDLANGDTGKPAGLGRFPDRSVHVKGTFGVGGAVAVEGSNDGGVTWATLHDLQGNDLVFTAAGVKRVAENTELIRPNVTGGDGSTDLDAHLVGYRRRRRRRLMRLGAPVGYHAPAVTFDGTDYLTRNTALAGAVDGTSAIVSFWFNVRDGDGTQRWPFASTGFAFRAVINSSNLFVFRMENAAGATICDLRTTAPILAGSGPHHFLLSCDLAAPGAAHLYIDDASDLSTVTFTNDLADFTVPDFAIGAQVGGAQPWLGDLADFYVAYNAYLDLSVEANRRKFISAAGRPVDLGANGELPTGTAPIIFFSGPASTWNSGTNKGTGGNFAMTGAVTDAGSI